MDGQRRGVLYEERTSAGTALLRRAFDWATSATSQPYVQEVRSTLDPDTTSAVTAKVRQAIDGYGNITQVTKWDYDLLDTKAKVYKYSYLSEALRVGNFIRNRLTLATVQRGVAEPAAETVTLASNTYDNLPGHPCATTALASVPAQDLRQHGSIGIHQTYYYRGNLTYSATPGDWACYEYDMTGMVRKTVTNLGEVSVTPKAGANNAVPGTTTAHGFNTAYNWTSALQLVSQTGPNQDTATVAYDSADRPQSTTSPHGAVTTYEYFYAAAPRHMKATTGNRWVNTYPDGFGRTVKVEAKYTENGQTVVDSIVETEYDSCACSPFGKVKRVSQPYRPTDAPVYTEYVYDALGRTIQVKHPPVSGSSGSSGTTTYSYSGNQVTVTDPAGRYKRFTTNAFGNLTWVVEPKPQGGGEYATANDYNLLDKLTAVTMVRDGATQIRTFGYNAQQRLSSVSLPETGTTSYTYNTDGTLLRRSDAKGQKVEYGYDVYKRLRTISRYRAGSPSADPCQSVTFGYDAVLVTDKDGGSKVSDRLVEATWGTAGSCPAGQISEQLTYNAAGLVTAKRLKVMKNSGAYGVLTGTLDSYFRYDDQGRIYEEYYPNSGPQLRTIYGASGRADHKYMFQSGINLVALNARYNAAGQVTNLLTPNGYNHALSFNARNQLVLHDVTGGAVPVKTEYVYSATNNDGRVLKQRDLISGEEISYTYDALMRLTGAITTDNPAVAQWGQAYDYDGFGNLYAQRVTKGSAPAFSLTRDSATNRILNFAYDANGNVVNDGTRAYSYDVENRLEANELSQSYSYGPDNRRIWDGTAYVVWSPDGRRIGRYTMQAVQTQTGWVWGFQAARTNLYFAGALIGQSDVAPGTVFTAVVTDRMGTVRARGTTALNFLPYGDERVGSANGQEKFGTYLRDSSGLDYADQRYYASRYARFMTPDPWLGSASVENPSGWNRYGYVQGDPVNFYDPQGLSTTGADVCAGRLNTSAGWGYIPSGCQYTSLTVRATFTGVATPAQVLNLQITGQLGQYSPIPRSAPPPQSVRDEQARRAKAIEDCVTSAAAERDQRLRDLPAPDWNPVREWGAFLLSLTSGVVQSNPLPIGFGWASFMWRFETSRIKYENETGRTYDSYVREKAEIHESYTARWVECQRNPWGHP